MHQGRGLEREAHPLVPHLMAGDTAQLPVNHKPVEGVLPAKLQLGQQLGNFPATFRHTRQPFQLFRLLPLIIGNFRPDFQLPARSGREQRNEAKGGLWNQIKKWGMGGSPLSWPPVPRATRIGGQSGGCRPEAEVR